ncbi:MAG TPA: HD domain-containing protein [Thermoanaerobaculia bacterium]|nr:HD domain-containing protein [Thermoanaerobaculia bacterium]
MPTTSTFRERASAARLKRFEVQLGAARAAFAHDVRNGQGGRAAHQRFSDRVDELIRSIVDDARPLARSAVSVSALGGYGRRALCLHSDLDLLLVFDGRIGRAEERFVKAVLHPLWDLHLQVGHQVRLLQDFGELERDNPLFLLALMDARPLAGDDALFERAREQFARSLEGARAEVGDALHALIEERHRQYNDTLYQLEPDTKDAPGGLRDISAARLLLSLADPSALRGSIDDARLAQAEDFLLRVRSGLHLEAGRNQNVLSHDLQETTAERLGCFGTHAQQRVESLMGEYFRYARAVTRGLERARRLARPLYGAGARIELGGNLVLGAEGVGFADERHAADQPASWLAALEAALDHGAALAPSALALFEREGPSYEVTDLLAGAADARRLLRSLRPRPGLYARLSELHDCGLLERFFPELQAISCRVIRDFFHKYTVDEHTLLTIRGIERLLEPEQPSRERFGSILAELDQPELLVLALLYHDVGKWKEDDHASESARMAQGMLDRMGISGDARQTVEFLILQHLAMSVVAFRRDTEDPEVVRRFARLVATEEHLKMLCLMTLADVEAVSTETLTPWREELLWRLYVDAYNQLTMGYGDEVIERGQDAVASLQATRPPDLGEGELAHFLEGFPQRYLALFEREDIYRHARLSRDISPDQVHLFLERKGGVWELAVVALDRPFLFSNLCGVLSYFGMDILRGSAMTSPSGLVLDIFQFTDREGFFRKNEGGTEQFETLLREVVAGRQDVAVLLERRESGLLFRPPPRRVAPIVRFDSEHSRRYSVLEIVAQDAPGLLHRVSLVISRHGSDVDLVLISTEGDRAIDVFHLTAAGRKLSEEAQLALKEEVEKMLEGSHETG